MNQQEEPGLFPSEQPTVKPSKKIPLSGAIFVTLFLCVAVFVSTFSALKVQTDRKLTKQTEQFQKYAKLESLLQYIDANYVRDLDEQQLWDSIYAGLFAGIGDPYTGYMTAEQYREYTADHSGSFVGIGINVVYDPDTQYMYIYRVHKGSPAEEAGLRSGDRIVEVEGIPVSLETYEKAVGTIAGETGSSVALKVQRDLQILELSPKRDNVASEYVFYTPIEQGDKKIARITVSTFAANSVYDQFADALEQAKEDGCDGYIFDVRNNPGGSLDVIVKVLDLLAPEGTLVHIVSADGSTETRTSDAEHFLDAPMVVLCNHSTASAAELFTADLRDFGLAKVVGETTYGKGTMQITVPLSDGSAFKLTTRYYTPKSAVSYDGIGIVPDHEVLLSREQKDRFYMLTPEEDPQLQEALALLK